MNKTFTIILLAIFGPIPGNRVKDFTSPELIPVGRGSETLTFVAV